MNDFKWRVWARRVAYFDAVVDVTLVLATFLMVIFLGGAYIIFIDKAHPLHEALVESLRMISKDFKITPSNMLYLAIFLTIFSSLLAIFFIRATYSLLSATKATPKHKDELNTAIEKCKTWQIVNIGVLVFNSLFNILQAWWAPTTIWGTNHLPPWKTLLKGLLLIGMRLGFQYVVGKYVTELKTGLKKKKK